MYGQKVFKNPGTNFQGLKSFISDSEKIERVVFQVHVESIGQGMVLIPILEYHLGEQSVQCSNSAAQPQDLGWSTY